MGPETHVGSNRQDRLNFLHDPSYHFIQPRGLWSRISRIGVALSVTTLIFVVDLYLQHRGEIVRADWMHRFGFDWDIMMSHRWWQLFTGTFVQSHGGIRTSMCIFVLLTISSVEILGGHRLAAVVGITSDWFATLVTSVIVKVVSMFGNETMTGVLHQPDSGSSALSHGALGATLLLLPRKLMIILFPLLVIGSAIEATTQRTPTTIAHTTATLFGMFFGWLARRRALREQRPPHIPTTSSGSSR